MSKVPFNAPMLKGTEQVRPGIVPPPIFRVAGYDRDDPAAHAIIQANLGRLAQFVNTQRQSYALSLGEIAPRGRRAFDDVSFTYDNVQGTETVTVTPRVGVPVEPPRDHPARWLLLEFLWEETGTSEGVPYLYCFERIRWNVALANFPGVGAGVYVTAFGGWAYNRGEVGNAGVGGGWFFPDLPAFLGAAGNVEAVNHSTEAEEGYYSSLFGGAETVGIVTGPSSIARYDQAPYEYAFYGLPSAWDTSNPTGPHIKRYKGRKHKNPHDLFMRVNQVGGAYDGQGVGIREPWESVEEVDFLDKLFDLQGYGVAKTTLQNHPTSRAEQITTIIIDLKKYTKEIGPMLKVRCSGFWASAHNSIHPTNDGPDVGDSLQQWFSTVEEFEAYQATGPKYGRDTSAWYDVPEPIQPHPVELRATLLFGPEDIQEYIDSPDVVTSEFTKVLYAKTISASQPTTNVYSPPDVLPWGDILGTVTLDIRQSILGFIKDK